MRLGRGLTKPARPEPRRVVRAPGDGAALRQLGVYPRASRAVGLRVPRRDGQALAGVGRAAQREQDDHGIGPAAGREPKRDGQGVAGLERDADEGPEPAARRGARSGAARRRRCRRGFGWCRVPRRAARTARPRCRAARAPARSVPRCVSAALEPRPQRPRRTARRSQARRRANRRSSPQPPNEPGQLRKCVRQRRRRPQLEILELEAGRHGAAAQHGASRRLRRLPDPGGHDRLRRFAVQSHLAQAKPIQPERGCRRSGARPRRSGPGARCSRTPRGSR